MAAASPPITDEVRGPLVLLVEDEVLVRTTLSTMLQFSGFRVIAVADADEALQVLEATPDVAAVITDVEMPRGSLNGFELARKIWDERRIGVVVISGRAVPERDELPRGIHFVAKPIHNVTLVHLVRSATGTGAQPQPSEEPPSFRAPAAERAPGEANAAPGLTARQREVLTLLIEGKSTPDIADALSLSENTVKVHLQAIYRVLGVSSRAAAVVAGMKLLKAE